MRGCGKKCFFAVLLSYLTMVGITINLDIIQTDKSMVSQLIMEVKGFSIDQLLFFAGLCFFYIYVLQEIQCTEWTLRDGVCVIAPAVLFAGFMVVGNSFAQTDSLELISKSGIQIIKTIIAIIGYGIAFTFVIVVIYKKIFGGGQEPVHRKGGAEKRGLIGHYKNMLVRAPFRTVFLTLLIVYIPYVILSYPAIAMGDFVPMVAQGFNFPEVTSEYLNLLDERIKLNGHHPVSYTLFIHICLVIGRTLFGSWNVGIFLVAISQLVGTCAVVAVAIRLLSKMQVQENILLGLIIYFAFAPRIQNYMFLITKDVFAASVLMLFSLSAYRLMWGEVTRKTAWKDLSIWGIGMGLLRNDGKYVILGSIAIMLLLWNEHRKVLLASGITIAVALGIFFNVLMPSCHITPTSRREALSVPFQQTARYFRDCRQEVTREEWDVVSAVLDADTIGENYNPTSADPVKGTFREGATKEELAAYFREWFKMGLKHPGVYMQATLNNYYNYFYPGEKLANRYSYNRSKLIMEEGINNHENLQSIGCSFHYPATLDSARTIYEKLRENFFEMPVFSLLKSTAIYVWSLILLIFYLIKEKAWKALALTAPLALSVGVCFLAPCNGDYFRYFYGTTFCIPVVFILSLYVCKYSKKEGTDRKF